MQIFLALENSACHFHVSFFRAMASFSVPERSTRNADDRVRPGLAPERAPIDFHNALNL